LAVLLGSVAPEAIAQIRAALVRDVDSPVRGIRHIENATPNFGSNAFSVTETITPAIPAGKKLFLQSAFVHTFLTDSQSVMEARVSILGVATIGYVPQVFQAASSTGGQRHFNGSADLDVVVNPGESISVFLFRNDNLGSSSLNFSRIVLVGYLVDANP
jgi:hypothetical protein